MNALDSFSEILLDSGQVKRVVFGHKADSGSGSSGAPCTAYSVYIILRILGQVIINHMGNPFYMDPSSGHVGRNDEVGCSFLKTIQSR